MTRPAYTTPVDEDELALRMLAPPLRTPEDATCLMLRTSGTTSKPKGAPLQQGQIVANGAILAATIGLRRDDVCYGIMPLFHIGGISASILCSIAVGASITCDGPYGPELMVEALKDSVPRPTWYSSVPTIHNATVAFLNDNAEQYGVAAGVWGGSGLRMIRSGAAALTGLDGAALQKMYGGVPVFPTYSMSEQMPISQPLAGMGDLLDRKPGSVGMPVAASCAIVSRTTRRPQPPGVEGEIAISGPTVLEQYLANPAADSRYSFYITTPGCSDPGSKAADGSPAHERFFLTGDVGVLDSEGFLSLKGRAKELIKKGGEQVSPHEVEESLIKHPWVRTAICVSVPHKLYGEEVGCALILSPDAPEEIELPELITMLRALLKAERLAQMKHPSKWRIVDESDIPKNPSKKYKRIGLSTVLGLDPVEKACPMQAPPSVRAKMDHAVLSGLRFYLAGMVMFMHIGADASWGAFGNLRQFPWHVHVFFTLGGYSMASAMAPPIKKKVSYFWARIIAMYPLYLLALLFAVGNLLVSCRPATFSADFH